ncbi:MAG: rhomboid family intramembrane serine protease [Thermoanaerobaculia bacterium]
MIPIRSTTPRQRTPWVTRTVAAVLLAVFAVQVAVPRIGNALVAVFGFIPARLVDPSLFGYTYFEAAFTLVTSTLIHGGVVHIAGNLVYLWVFGGAVEERLGHGRFFAIYLTGGIAGSLVHAAVFPTSNIPSIGASGCIAAVLGAFLILFPTEPVVTLIPLFVSWVLVEVPGIILLPLWFAMQFLNGWLALQSAAGTEEVGGIAWWAHIGGFVYGMVVGAVVRIRRRSADDTIAHE